MSELASTLPELTLEDIHWRFHFLVGAMIYTMSDSGQLEGLSGGRCSARQTDAALAHMVATFSALFRAPTLKLEGTTRLTVGGRKDKVGGGRSPSPSAPASPEPAHGKRAAANRKSAPAAG